MLPAAGPVLAIVTRLWAAVKIGKLIWNSVKIYRVVSRFSGVIDSLVKERRLPKNHESADFLRSLADLVRLKIFDFPGIEEDEVAKHLEALADELLEGTQKTEAA
ncbi:MAG: hypothetical protein HC883_01030 [Bdellovibrionaceae bacterium]|nr:hypothetical protein [Pseudobdellovibrionaceae bacterium]